MVTLVLVVVKHGGVQRLGCMRACWIHVCVLMHAWQYSSQGRTVEALNQNDVTVCGHMRTTKLVDAGRHPPYTQGKITGAWQARCGRLRQINDAASRRADRSKGSRQGRRQSVNDLRAWPLST
jgi:hypothetical protein